MSSDYPGWLNRAQGNPRGVGVVIGLPADFVPGPAQLAYETGANLAMRRIQFFYYWALGKTFRRFPAVTVRLPYGATAFASMGMKEATAAVLDAAKTAGLKMGGRLVDKGDEMRLWVSMVPAPKGYLGGTIGIDNYRPASDAAKIATWPWPGRTGLQGKGLELIALRPPIYDGSTGYKVEGHADEPSEWEGALAHEIGHCLCGLDHCSNADAELCVMMEWWGFLGYPLYSLCGRHGMEAVASPFVR